MAAASLDRFLSAHRDCAVITVQAARGSTPREAGTFMVVSAASQWGTIGGGQLEFMAIDKARALLGGSGGVTEIAVPLGPEIGQCCGGHVTLSIERLDESGRKSLLEQEKLEIGRRPTVHLFGGGHVGRALAQTLSLLPVKTILIETRADQIADLPGGVEGRLAAVPEEEVRRAPPGSAFVILTHDHALDFLITAAALARNDAAYVGMIGSATKRVQFERWFLREAGGEASLLGRLVMPIGGSFVRDKRPEIIAALAAAEIVTGLSRRGA